MTCVCVGGAEVGAGTCRQTDKNTCFHKLIAGPVAGAGSDVVRDELNV